MTFHAGGACSRQRGVGAGPVVLAGPIAKKTISAARRFDNYTFCLTEAVLTDRMRRILVLENEQQHSVSVSGQCIQSLAPLSCRSALRPKHILRPRPIPRG